MPDSGAAVGGRAGPKPLRELMMTKFRSFTIKVAVLVFALLVIMLIVVTSVTVGLTRDGLATQLRSHAALASGEVAAAVDMRFRAVEGLVMMLANLQTQMRSSSYPLQPTTDYRDNDPALPTSAAEPTRHPGNINLVNSVWYLNDATTLTAAITTERDRSVSFNHFFPSLWAEHPMVQTMFIGWESKLFRSFPGEAKTTRTYDPTARPWYQPAVDVEGTAVHTPPYLDAFGQGVLITVSAAGTTGVAGADITLSTIRAAIADIEFFGQKSATLARLDGTIVAAASIPDAQLAGKSVTRDLDVPISAALLKTMTDWSGTGDRLTTQTYDVEAGGQTWVVARSFIPPPPTGSAGVFGYSRAPRYVVLVALPEESALEQAGFDEMVTSLSLSMVPIALGLGVFIWLMSVAGHRMLDSQAREVTEPLTGVAAVAAKISDRGTDGIKQKHVDGIAPGRDEVASFVDEFKLLITRLTSGGTTRVAAGAEERVPNKWHSEHHASGDYPWRAALSGAGGAGGEEK